MKDLKVKVRRKLMKTDGKIRFMFFHQGGREHYNLRIYLDGDDRELDKIEKVEYELHPSFPTPRQGSSDRDDNFAIEIWTWGTFDIKVKIQLKNGANIETDFYLDYNLPADNGTNYIEL